MKCQRMSLPKHSLAKHRYMHWTSSFADGTEALARSTKVDNTSGNVTERDRLVSIVDLPLAKPFYDSAYSPTGNSYCGACVSIRMTCLELSEASVAAVIKQRVPHYTAIILVNCYHVRFLPFPLCACNNVIWRRRINIVGCDGMLVCGCMRAWMCGGGVDVCMCVRACARASV